MNIEGNSSFGLPENIFGTGEKAHDSRYHDIKDSEAGGVFWGHQVSEKTVPEDGLHIPKKSPESADNLDSVCNLSPLNYFTNPDLPIINVFCDPKISSRPDQVTETTTSPSTTTVLPDWQLRDAAEQNIPSFPRRRESTTTVDPRLRGDDDGINLSASSLSFNQPTVAAPTPQVKREVTYSQDDPEKISKANERKRKNRESARKSRQNKEKNYCEMSQRVKNLEAENKSLIKVNTALTEKMNNYDKTLQHYSEEIKIVENAFEAYYEEKYGSGHSTSEQGEATKPNESSVKANDTVINNYLKATLKNRDAEIANLKLKIQQRDARIASLEAKSVTTASQPTGGTGIVVFVQTDQTQNTNTPF
ncbi:hypothetical protein NX722_03360 [Endozoicomonas gorgoniicola]|uniref:BZIP domain-containing protein n=1 Tax=Endozoicomonas gorgoniicola TaxID=1234144 RepID=A0ABT3MQP6_9GAMM|nr:hypothetical protein [Endozoicomonas gorgoniicola]MCW7551696.1 hypothetical protein [Endozoicomonas gorgoniicola]